MAVIAVTVLWIMLTRSVLIFEKTNYGTLKTRTVAARLRCAQYNGSSNSKDSNVNTAGLLEVITEVSNPSFAKVAVCCVREEEFPNFSRGSPCGGRRDLTGLHTNDSILLARGQNEVLISSAQSLRVVCSKQLSSKTVEEVCARPRSNRRRQPSAAIVTIFLENHNRLVSNNAASFTTRFWHSSPYSPENFFLSSEEFVQSISDLAANAERALLSSFGAGSFSTWTIFAIRSIGQPIARQYAKVRPISSCYEARAILGRTVAALDCESPNVSNDPLQELANGVCGLVKAGHLGVTCIILLNLVAYVALQPKSGWEISRSNFSLPQKPPAER